LTKPLQPMPEPNKNTPEYPVQQQMEQNLNTAYSKMFESMQASLLIDASKAIVKNIKTK
jgi:hypothetical protein